MTNPACTMLGETNIAILGDSSNNIRMSSVIFFSPFQRSSVAQGIWMRLWSCIYIYILLFISCTLHYISICCYSSRHFAYSVITLFSYTMQYAITSLLWVWLPVRLMFLQPKDILKDSFFRSLTKLTKQLWIGIDKSMECVFFTKSG